MELAQVTSYQASAERYFGIIIKLWCKEIKPSLFPTVKVDIL